MIALHQSVTVRVIFCRVPGRPSRANFFLRQFSLSRPAGCPALFCFSELPAVLMKTAPLPFVISAIISDKCLPRNLFFPNFAEICRILAAKPQKTHLYGTNRWVSRGNSAAILTLSKPKRRAVRRSKPIPKPPWGGIPYRWICR